MAQDESQDETPPRGSAGPLDDAPTQRSWAVPGDLESAPKHQQDHDPREDPSSSSASGGQDATQIYQPVPAWTGVESDDPTVKALPSDTTVRYPGPGDPDPTRTQPQPAVGGDAGWYAAPAPYPAPGPGDPAASATDGADAADVPPYPPADPPPSEASPSGLAGFGLAAASTLRRHRRQTVTFAYALAVVLVLGAGAFAVFKGTITWPFGGGPGPAVPAASASASACSTPTATVQAAGLTTVRVYNATSRRGFALSVARDLQKRGFKVPTVGNDPLGSSPTTAVIRHGPQGILAAHTLGSQLAGTMVYQQDDRAGTTVDLVLGPRFALLNAKKAAAALKATASPNPGCPTAG
jgi:hypothetical protein